MKIIDNMPIITIVAALLINIATGVNNQIGFSVLMIRCIIVTIVFGILGYMLSKTLRSAVEYSILSKNANKTGKGEATEDNQNDNRVSFDIKVPPLDDVELLNINNDSDNDFIELNPVRLKSFGRNEQE